MRALSFPIWRNSATDALWRYEPVVISHLTPLSFHLRNFEWLASALEGTTKRCYVSFFDVYHKTKRNLSRLGEAQEGARRPHTEEQRELLLAFGEMAASHGMTLHVCCDDIPEEALAPKPARRPCPNHEAGSIIHRARCVDPDLVRHLAPDLSLPLEPRPTRPGCGCVRSVDIGAYDTCLFGYLYCYASSSLNAALARHRSHSPDDTILYRPPRLRGVDLDSLLKKNCSPLINSLLG